MVEHNPSPEKIKRHVIENPKDWQRVYLTYLSTQHPDLIDAKMVDEFPLHAQLMGFEEHGWHKYDGYMSSMLEVYKSMT